MPYDLHHFLIDTSLTPMSLARWDIGLDHTSIASSSAAGRFTFLLSGLGDLAPILSGEYPKSQTFFFSMEVEPRTISIHQ